MDNVEIPKLKKGEFKLPFPKDDYRDQICRTSEFRKCWPLVRLMLDNTDYKKRIEKTIEKYS